MKINPAVLALSLVLITIVSAFAVPGPTGTPDFSMAPTFTTLNIPAGQVGAATINITSVSGFSGDVALQPSPPPSGCVPVCTTWSLSPSSVTLGTNQLGTATLIIIAGTQGGSANITVTGTSGTISHMSVIGYVVLMGADFAMTASPSQVTFSAGSTATSTITVTSVGGFAGTVVFSLASSPNLVTEIAPQNLTGSGTAVVFLSAIVPGNYTATITGTSGSLVHSTALLVAAVDPPPSPDFTVNAVPLSVTVSAGSSASSTITLTGINGFTGQIVLSAITSSSGLSASLNPASVFVSSGSVSSILTVSATSAVAPGTYQVTVTGTSVSLAHILVLSVTVTAPVAQPDFTISVTPPVQTVRRGSTTTYTITITGIDGFNGAVSLSATVTPLNSRDPVLSLPPLVDSNTNSTLTVGTRWHTPRTTYAIVITAMSGTLVHTVTVYLTVTK